MRIYIKVPPEVRFWKRVNKYGPVHPVLKTRCWLWTGGIADTTTLHAAIIGKTWRTL